MINTEIFFFTFFYSCKLFICTVVGVMKMGNTVPRAGLKPTSLAFRAGVLSFHHIAFSDVITTPTPKCLYSSLPQRSVQTSTIIKIKFKKSKRINPLQFWWSSQANDLSMDACHFLVRRSVQLGQNKGCLVQC